MTDHEALFSMLAQQGKLLEQQTDKLTNIEKALTTIAVQGTEIDHLEGQINKLWQNYDKVWGPGGTLEKMKTYQASCPAEALKRTVAQLWVAIGLVVTLIGTMKILE